MGRRRRRREFPRLSITVLSECYLRQTPTGIHHPRRRGRHPRQRHGDSIQALGKARETQQDPGRVSLLIGGRNQACTAKLHFATQVKCLSLQGHAFVLKSLCPAPSCLVLLCPTPWPALARRPSALQPK
ncbi:unnamed protein product [Lota lota]